MRARQLARWAGCLAAVAAVSVGMVLGGAPVVTASGPGFVAATSGGGASTDSATWE